MMTRAQARQVIEDIDRDPTSHTLHEAQIAAAVYILRGLEEKYPGRDSVESAIRNIATQTLGAMDDMVKHVR